MKRVFILLGILLVGVVLYVQNVSSCDTPISYRIGSIDPQFNLSREEVLNDIKTATDILSSSAKKQLFVYSDNAQLTVNFTYDKRAALDTQINQLQSQLNQKGSTLDQQVKNYEADVNQFEQKLADFNATVDNYNKQGGAPQDVYRNLIERQKQLQEEANSLNQRARQLKLSTHEYNVGVSALNNDTAQFNNELAMKPEEGLYNAANDTITLYFASNYNELIHTLAHEFGHVLGMDHVNNPEAIMYSYSTTSITPTSEDLDELANVCRYEPLPVYLIKAADKWFVLTFYPVIQNYLNR